MSYHDEDGLDIDQVPTLRKSNQSDESYIKDLQAREQSLLRIIALLKSKQSNVQNNDQGDTTNNTITLLSTSLIHKIFEYIDYDYKLLIHREGSTDEQRSKKLSIELIMRSGLEDYFARVLRSRRMRDKLCEEAARRGYVSTLKWAREDGCKWGSTTCKYAAAGGHLDCLKWAREHGCDWDVTECLSYAKKGTGVLNWIKSLSKVKKVKSKA